MAVIGAPLAEAWLAAVMLAAGLSLGALLGLAMGRLLLEAWVAPLHPMLAAIARGTPVLGLLAVPLLPVLAEVYPWARSPTAGGWYDPAAVGLRGLAILALWTALGRMLARPDVSRRAAGAALVALVLSGAIAMQDWALSRDQAWSGSLQGLALLAGKAAAALALSTLVALRSGMPHAAARTGIERALLSLAMATLWLWFVQYIVVYAADLPPEAAWYLRRSTGAWWWVTFGIALPALLAAIGLALVPQWRRWRLVAVGILLLVQNVAHVWWVVRPDAPAGGAPVAAWMDAVAAVLVGSVMLVAWRLAARPAGLASARSPAMRPRPARMTGGTGGMTGDA